MTRRRQFAAGLCALSISGLTVGCGYQSAVASTPRTSLTHKLAPHSSSTSSSSVATIAYLTTHTQSVSSLPRLQALVMRSQSDGWALGQGQLYSTADGGLRWRRVTPPRVTLTPMPPYGTAWDFTGPQSAWIVSPLNVKAGRFLISRTTDAGLSWHQSRIVLPKTGGAMPVQLDVLNANRGWLALSSGASGPAVPLQLWKTVNGGQTWRRIYVTSASGGAITFTNAQDGWMVTQQPANPGTLFTLERSATGGRTWQVVSLPSLPRFFEDGQDNGAPALSWMGSDGFILGSTVGGGASHGYVAVLRTTNVGRTWAVTPKISASDATTVAATITGGTAWVIADSQLYVGRHAGSTWLHRGKNPLLTHIDGIDALTPNTAWIWRTGNQGTQLWETNSAGANWTAVH